MKILRKEKINSTRNRIPGALAVYYTVLSAWTTSDSDRWTVDNATGKTTPEVTTPENALYNTIAMAFFLVFQCSVIFGL